MAVTVESDGSGITAFEVEVRPSREFQGVGVTIRYGFGGPVEEADVYGPAAEVAGLAQELAGKKLDELIAQASAAKQGEVERQQQRGASGGAKRAVTKARTVAEDKGVVEPVPEPEWAQAQRPNGRGTIRYRPTSNLPTDALKALVRDAVQASGADPDLHVIYDERIGERGLEKTRKGYTFATVKPTEDNPAFGGVLKTARNGNEYPQASFYVDFNDDGTVRVKPTPVYIEAAKAAKAQAEAPPPPPTDQELPF